MKDGKYVTVKQFSSEEAAMSAMEDAEGLIDHMKVMDGVHVMVFDSEDHKEEFVSSHEMDLVGESISEYGGPAPMKPARRRMMKKKKMNERSSRAEIEGAMEWWHGEIMASNKRQRAAMGYGRPESIRELIKRPIPMLKYHIKMYNAYLDEYGPFDEVPSRLEEEIGSILENEDKRRLQDKSIDIMTKVSKMGKDLGLDRKTINYAKKNARELRGWIFLPTSDKPKFLEAINAYKDSVATSSEKREIEDIMKAMNSRSRI
tara:strand:+ start:3991 stop:4770 length:780 start_codon:yes stop_codon:yes gene_type:complete